MADDPRYSRWIEEQRADYRHPIVGGWSTIALLIVVALIALQAFSATDANGKPARYTGPAPCAQDFPPTCPERPGR